MRDLVMTPKQTDTHTAHCFTQFFGYALQISQRNLSCLVVVKQIEYFLNILAGVFVALQKGIIDKIGKMKTTLVGNYRSPYHFGGHHIKKFIKIYGATAVFINISNQLETNNQSRAI